MGITANILRQISIGNRTVPDQAQSPRFQVEVVDGSTSVDTVVAAGATVNIEVLIDPIFLRYLLIYASENGVTFQSDPVTSGNPLITIQDAGTPFLWSQYCGLALPLHEPVTTMTIHNPSANAAQVNIEVGYM